MKSIFLRTFLNVMGELLENLPTFFARESLYYKDLRLGGYDPKKIYQGMHNLRHRGIVRFVDRDRFTFTSEGKRWLRSRIPKSLLRQPGRWDRTWRMVLFDIPREYSRARRMFKRRLEWWGFHPFQKSVFVIPYPCDDEVVALAHELDIGDYVVVALVKSLGSREREIRKAFSLTLSRNR